MDKVLTLAKHLGKSPTIMALDINLRLRHRFNLYHPEKLPSAQDRYVNEVNRVVKVLDTSLVGKSYLVGDKCTYADLSFVMWNMAISIFMSPFPERFDLDAYPNFKSWQERLCARPAVKKIMDIRVKMMKEDGLNDDGTKGGKLSKD